MRSVRQLLPLLPLAFFVAGCGYKLVPADSPREIAGLYTVQPQIEWSGIESDDVELWTIHGRGLEALQFVSKVEDGDPLFEADSEIEEKRPKFRANMLPSEIAELCVDTVAQEGAANPEHSGLRPASFGGHKGFRFEFSFTAESGLEVSGMAAGAVIDEELYLILFTAPSMHYFETLSEVVDRIIASVQL